ncbi:MAG: GMC oxidoreductase [Hyphomonadaceae bacterium]
MNILIIGSGPSGVHFALSALRKGHRVVMLDVGAARPAIAAPASDFLGLKRDLADPTEYFVGGDYGAISLPSAPGEATREYYGLPPSKDYVFARPQPFVVREDGFSTLLSFAAGGLAESWTGGAYPLGPEELADFPFTHAELKPHYDEVAARIGVGGLEDDLAEFFPHHDHLLAPIALDRSSAALLASYEARRARLARKSGARLGRSRQAALSAAKDDRSGCRQCGRCLWGCPNGAFYTPSITLAECRRHAAFDYRPGLFVSHFECAGGALAGAMAYPLNGGAEERFTADAYVLAAGAISSSNIVLRSHFKATGEIVRLEGLMDNRQVLAPFFNLAMLGKAYDAGSYQYHQLACALPGEAGAEAVHAQITTMTTASAHPVLQSLPLDMRSAMGVFRLLRSGLGVVNLNFADRRRAGNYLTLAPEGDAWPALSIRYRPPEGEAKMIRAALARTGKFFADLGAPLIPGMAHIRPMGSSVHYSGTLPMSAEPRAWTVSRECRSHDFDNLYVIDGAAMPALPAKNLTFTLMANAVRVAEEAF